MYSGAGTGSLYLFLFDDLHFYRYIYIRLHRYISGWLETRSGNKYLKEIQLQAYFFVSSNTFKNIQEINAYKLTVVSKKKKNM